MAPFSSPDWPVPDIVSVLGKTGIASIKEEDITNPTADLVCTVYANFVGLIDPLTDDMDGQISFAALEILENPDHHVDSIRIFNLYRKIKEIFASIQIGFNLRDLLDPDPHRTYRILCGVVNFLFYRDEKLNLLKPIVDELATYEERKMELETKIAELNKEILSHDAACQKEEPMVQELEAEVKELRLKIQNYNKHQASLKTVATGLKEKIDTTDEKISKVDFEINQGGLENVYLMSNIVQSPDKLQKALEVKKLNRAEVKESERSAEQRVHEQAATLEVYTKAFEKMSKLSSKVQDIQEKINSAKAVDKDLKALKATLTDQGVSNMKLDAKIAEWQGKAKQVEELSKTAEKEKDLRHAEDIQRLNTVKAEMERKLGCLESREGKIEAMVAKGKSLCSEAELVREDGKVKVQKMWTKCEEIVCAFHSYSDTINPYLQMEEEKGGSMVTGVTER